LGDKLLISNKLNAFMELEFVNRNINLQMLFKEIERGFVIAKDFKILRKKLEKESFFMAFDCPSIPGVVRVIVEGSPERFLVKFFLKEDRLLSLISYIGIPFGTGYLYLRNVKKMENFRRLEKEFYEFLSKVVVSLENSAGKPS
jgi:hypothetical protein